MDARAFFGRLARLLKDNPPAPADGPIVGKLAKIAIEPGKDFDIDAIESLDVYIQSTSPGADKESNWLPCPPSGSFNLTVRSYQPKESLLDGSYVLPPVRKVS